MIVTSGNQSYAVFTYFCGSLSSHSNGTIGFNSDGSFFKNHPFSATSRTNEVACLNYPRTTWSNLIYSLTPVSGKILSIGS